MTVAACGLRVERMGGRVLDTTFIDELASKAPTPGGGGACAYVGALAAALASMVGNLTVGKKTYAAVEAEVYVSLEKLDDARSRFVQLVEEDARAFDPMAAAYRMPRDTPEQLCARNAALQTALVGACDVPLDIMRGLSDVIEPIDFLAHQGSRLALSDAGVAAAFARAAVEGASLNVYGNVAAMDDVALAGRYREEAAALVRSVRERCDALLDYVKSAISQENHG